MVANFRRNSFRFTLMNGTTEETAMKFLEYNSNIYEDKYFLLYTTPEGSQTLTTSDAQNVYPQLTDEIEVVVDGSDSTAVGLTASQIYLALTEFVRVANTPGTLLPSTGGVGTKIFYIGGAVLILAAIAVILIATCSKKKAKSN